jgi:hypothetical protein
VPSRSPPPPAASRRGTRRGCSIAHVAGDHARLREIRTDVFASPAFGPVVLIAIVLIAVVVRQLFVHPPSVIVFGVCAVLALLDVGFAWYLLRVGGAIFSVTPTEITFTARPIAHAHGKRPPPQVIRRTGGSTLSFRVQDKGIAGDQAQSLLKLRDDVTGQEVAATVFGHRQVRRACESQGWRFS